MLSAVKLFVTNDQELSVETSACTRMEHRSSCDAVLSPEVHHREHMRASQIQTAVRALVCVQQLQQLQWSDLLQHNLQCWGMPASLLLVMRRPYQADHGRAWAGIAIRHVYSSEQDLVSIDMRL